MPAVFTDSYKLKGLRKQLAASLRQKGIFDVKVIEAVENVPRHFFVDTIFAEQVYEDKAFPIQAGQTISQPFTVAYQTQLLDIKKGDKVLEIGTGSGYQCAILVYLGAKVYSIERHESLSLSAREALKHLRYNAKLIVGDGSLGLPKYAPYDKILVTAAAPEAPKQLLNQLKIGGWLIIPVGSKDIQQMVKYTRTSEENFQKNVFERFRFVPLIGKEAW